MKNIRQWMKWFMFSVGVLIMQGILVQSAGAADYYLDSVGGRDEAAGMSAGAAWKSFEKISKISLKPGDRVLLKSGSKFKGLLVLTGKGTPEKPVIVDKYGGDALPVIDGSGAAAALQIENPSCMIIQNLELTNSGEWNKQLRDGLRIAWTGTEKAEYQQVYVRKLHVHHVQGIVTRKTKPSFYGNAGINIRSANPAAAISDIRVEDCRINDVRCIGCWISGKNEKRNIKDVVFRRNRIERTGCDGLIVLKATDVLVEHNRCYDAGALGVKKLKTSTGEAGTDYIAGLWVGWYVHNSIFQYNEVARTRKFKGDGSAFDVDNEVTGTHIFQYNYTHENDSGPYMQTKTAKPDKVIFRYNISVNDNRIRNNRHMGFHFAGKDPRVYVYNNVFYTDHSMPMTISNQSQVYFTNNIFVSKKAGYRYPARPVFKNNLFFGKHHVNDKTAIRKDPMLVNPGPPKDGFEHADNYKIKPESPCRNAGVPIKDNGGRDFWGNKLYSDQPDIGAHEAGEK